MKKQRAKRKDCLDVPRDCKQCGDEFLAKSSEIRRGSGKFCSKKCYVAYKLTNNAMVQVECQTCGKAMKMYQVQAKSRRFCSSECSAESQRNTVTCKCKLCGKEFESWKSNARQFCSRKCSAKGQGRKERPPAKRIVCQACGKVFLVEEFNRDRKYCTHKCATDSLRKSDIQKARRRGKEHLQWALAVLKRDKKCVRCGAIENLQAHHVKHWKKCPEKRFDVENGATLCVYCHHAQHPNIPLKNFVAVGGVSVRYCVVCESAYVSRSKVQRACSRKCGARLTADGRLSKKKRNLDQ